MSKREERKDLVKRFAATSTKASAKLERREVPAEFVRSQKVEQFLTQRRSRG